MLRGAPRLDPVGPLAAPHIQRPAGWPARDLGDQLGVRLAAPYALRRTVSLVPEILAEYLAGAVRVLTHPPSMASHRSAHSLRRTATMGGRTRRSDQTEIDTVTMTVSN